MNNGKLNFIIPVRHFKTVNDWQVVQDNLEKTLNTIFLQTDNSWHCFIACNTGTILPSCTKHDKITIIEKDFPLSILPPKQDNPERYHDLIRQDKGLRVYAALNKCSNEDFIMVVDYDDFLHKDIVKYVSEDQRVNNGSELSKGYLVSRGYVYSGGSIALINNTFDMICGTSNIFKVSFLTYYYNSDGQLPNEYIKKILGSHRFIKEYMKERSEKYTEIPFPAVIYNVGIINSASSSPSILRRVFSLKKLIGSPRTTIKLWFSIRFFRQLRRKDFNIT